MDSDFDPDGGVSTSEVFVSRFQRRKERVATRTSAEIKGMVFMGE